MKDDLVLLDLAVASLLDTEGLKPARNACCVAVRQLGVLFVVGEAHDIGDVVVAICFRPFVLL